MVETALRELTGFEHGARGVGVRDLVVVLPSVGCTNRTVELLAREEPRVRVITHQHGCGQLGDDLSVTADLLAHVCAHPNVRAALIVGLGCESLQSDRLLDRALSLGANVERTVLQDNGGNEATVAAGRAALAPMLARESARVVVPASAIKVGVIADDASGSLLAAAVSAELRAAGIEVVEAGAVDADPVPSSSQPVRSLVGVPRAWEGRKALQPLEVLPLALSSRNEQITALAARGAHACVFITGRANPIGSPVMPTLKVGIGTRYAPLVGGVIDLLVDLETTALEASARDVAKALLDALDGREVAAERAGQRDFGIPRIAPTM